MPPTWFTRDPCRCSSREHENDVYFHSGLVFTCLATLSSACSTRSPGPLFDEASLQYAVISQNSLWDKFNVTQQSLLHQQAKEECSLPLAVVL